MERGIKSKRNKRGCQQMKLPAACSGPAQMLCRRAARGLLASALPRMAGGGAQFFCVAKALGLV